MQKEHIKELDVLRMIGFVFVVAQHVFGAYAWREGAGFYESLILNLFYVIAQPAVPIFVMITAISLFYNHSEGVNIFTFYKKRILYIFLPYVIWSIINIMDAKQYGQASFDNFVGQLAAGTGRYHLWYMSMILRIYLFFPLILWLSKRIRKLPKFYKVGFLLICFVFYIILLKNNGITFIIGKSLFKTPTYNEQMFIDRTPLLWSIYFVVGAYVIFWYPHLIALLQRYRKFIVLTYTPLLLYIYYIQINPHFPGHNYITIGYLYCFLKVSYMILAFFMFYSLASYIVNQKPKLYRLFKDTSPYSYSAYLAHVIVLQAVAMEVDKVYPIKSFLLQSLLIYILTIALTIKVIQVLSLFPFSKYFLGTSCNYYKEFFNKRDLPFKFIGKGFLPYRRGVAKK
ncbi:acyltransferase [Desulfosporosinus sp. FKA]|uniref:acyltransferase n=1 Tax=Desulfosporosinus sp. FKA TaxID=1969834 RepID=UPI000B4A1E2E|nr:acyltransferase [Desulfosporosinus sp. FKA]